MQAKKHLISTFALVILANLSLLGQTKDYNISGKILDKSSRQPIEYATVMVNHPETKDLVGGTTSLEDGSFSVDVKATKFQIELSFIGYENLIIDQIDFNSSTIELGDILLSENSQTLDEVVVRAEKSQTEFKLDKRVFNVGSDLSSTGASALEVLNNVPSVTVDIEGGINLRGSGGVQILINGKPSVMAGEQGNALGTITADMIEKVEVITNPSAKYDAEGTSGIINIIIKKEDKRGINGSLTLNTGVPNNHSIGFSLNRRTEKFNLFSQLGFGHRSLPRDSESINRDRETGSEIISSGTGGRDETYFNLILGTDYHINDLNVITLSGHYAFEAEKGYSHTDFTSYESAMNTTSQWFREEDTEAGNPKMEYELNYKKQFTDHEDHSLIFSSLGTLFSKDQSSDFFNRLADGSPFSNDQKTRTDFGELEYTFKLDYTHPINEHVSFETGVQYVIKDVGNDFAVENLENNIWTNVPEQTNVFEYDQKVFGVYGTSAYENDLFGIKIGLRMEHTDLTTLLKNTNEKNIQNFPNFFPSAHTSYKLSDRVSLQAGYSRRIFRPRLWDLNPFFNIRNNYNIRAGNPNLQPEFTDSYEVTSIYILEKISMNFGVYHRYTTDVVERVSTFRDNVSTSTPLNIGTNKATGVEYNAKYTPAKWLALNGDFNFNYFKREGTYEGTSFDFDANRWSTRVTAKLNLPADFDVELSGNYRSKFKSFQRENLDQIFMDLGVRKKVFKGKAIANLSIRDVFASRIGESIVDQPSFYLSQRGWQGRFIIFGVSYGFGKGEAMEFSGAKRF